MISVWLKLLRKYNNHVGFGLTLPFLIGATRTPVGSIVTSKDQNIADVRQLLVSIRDDTPPGSYISLSVCDRIGQPVFAETSNYFSPAEVLVRIPRPEGKACSLCVTPDLLAPAEGNLESLLAVLWNVNGDALLRGEFSFNNGAFKKYSSKDFALISSAHEVQADDENP